MAICSKIIGYCFQEQKTIVFPIVFGNFCNLIVPKQGIEMQIANTKVVEIFKKWARPRQVTFKCSPRVSNVEINVGGNGSFHTAVFDSIISADLCNT